MDEFLTRMTKYLPKLNEYLIEKGKNQELGCAAGMLQGIPCLKRER